MRNYESEFGTKQSCSYEVRHFYKKLFFNPGIYFDENPFPRNNGDTYLKSKSDISDDFMKMQMKETDISYYDMQYQDNSHTEYVEKPRSMLDNQMYKAQGTKGFNQVNDMFV